MMRPPEKFLDPPVEVIVDETKAVLSRLSLRTIRWSLSQGSIGFNLFKIKFNYNGPCNFGARGCR